MSKEEEIYKYSNPDKVKEIADNEFGKDNYELLLSTRKNKKYMIRGEFTDNKWVHFGQMGYEDYTKHNDKRRRNLFRKRNYKWYYMDKDTPAFISTLLLW